MKKKFIKSIGMAAQHSQCMEKFFFGIPGLLVIAPSDAFTAMGLLKSAIRSNNAVLFFRHKLLYAKNLENALLPSAEKVAAEIERTLA
ncbi:MAG: hypothetical protein KJO34_13900 [Deltaproteobacteria bacterium]|nr:hypothetical protein [Deltaproteobacteria bacterium]